jgi:hypothetical protein
MRFYWLVLGILGVWQITHLLHAEDGPWRSLQRLRAFLTGLGLGIAVTCFYCLSIWVALPIAFWIGESWPERILLWFALAGAVSLMERALQGNAPPPATYFEDAPAPAQEGSTPKATEGNGNVQLRQQEPAVGGITFRPGSIAGGNGGREAARSDLND